ncbi:hypothetical protein LC593_20915 [Nostoc sp. CHAB 5844]|nr:hypothetical protein [Nostoc sp. CHAB 5844]
MIFLNKKCMYYELKYLSFKLKFHKILLLFFTVVGAIVVSLGDAQAFFNGENSPIPKSWTVFKKTSNARMLALAIIVIPSISVILSNNVDEKEEFNYLSKITQKITLPFFEDDLNNFHKNICRKFQLSSNTRLYIMIPTRNNFFQWYLKTIAKTSNFDDKEIEVLLRLDEGSVGYAFQLMNKDFRFTTHYVSLIDLQNLPADYIAFPTPVRYKRTSP